MEMLFSCPRCTGAHLASQNRNLGAPLHWLVPIWRPKIGNLGALPKMVDFLISR